MHVSMRDGILCFVNYAMSRVCNTACNITSYVQMMGATGLVHKSELSWEAVTVTSAVVRPEMEVKVKVLEIDAEKGHVSLSIKQCEV